MSSVINDGFDSSGTLNARERTSYTYDSKSFRTFLLTETGTSFSPDLNTENWQLKTETQFLADHHNHTGYTQTIRETTTNADGTTKTTDYTFGHDEISQRVVERDAAGNITSDTTHLFGHDGHGSVRMLTDLSGVIAQVFTFAAYGSMVAVHSGNGTLAGTTEAAALTSLGYSGEHFDGKAQQQYLRARFYNPANGRFNRLDPFAGNSTDPQSFHKYLYTHGDPVSGTDPSGLLLLAGLGGLLGGFLGRSKNAVAIGAAVGFGAHLGLRLINRMLGNNQGTKYVFIYVNEGVDGYQNQHFDAAAVRQNVQSSLDAAGVDVRVGIYETSHDVRQFETGFTNSVESYFAHFGNWNYLPPHWVVGGIHDLLYLPLVRDKQSFTQAVEIGENSGFLATTPNRYRTPTQVNERLLEQFMRRNRDRGQNVNWDVMYANLILHEVFYLSLMGGSDNVASNAEGLAGGSQSSETLLTLTPEEAEDIRSAWDINLLWGD